jgi:hypothetical protein
MAFFSLCSIMLLPAAGVLVNFCPALESPPPRPAKSAVSESGRFPHVRGLKAEHFLLTVNKGLPGFGWVFVFKL